MTLEERVQNMGSEEIRKDEMLKETLRLYRRTEAGGSEAGQEVMSGLWFSIPATKNQDISTSAA